MASEITVFVAFDGRGRVPAPGEAEAAVRGAEPRWTVEGRGAQAFAVGLYDWAPVAVALDGSAAVAAEAETLARTALARTADAALAARLRAATARFTIGWDLRRDPDPVPETAEVVVRCATLLAALVGGTAVVAGTGAPLDPAPDTAVAQLFPP